MSARVQIGGGGILLAVLSAATFGTSGTFATSLLDAGWSPAAAVIARLALAALILTGPGIIALRRCWPALHAAGPAAIRASITMVGVYGLVAVAGCQLMYFNAVQHLSVGVALMLEYLGIVFVVVWLWLRHHQRPRRLTVLGSLGSLIGLAFVLDLTGHEHLDPIGVLWGLGAAVGLAAYYLLSARTVEALPPIVMAWGAMTVGAVLLIGLALVGAVPVSAHFGDVTLGGHRTSWLVPVLGLSLIAAVIAYVLGIAAARALGAKLASFVGLAEVLFAVLFAWAFLNQLPTAIQLVGGAFIVAGVTLVRIDELRGGASESAEVSGILVEPDPIVAG
jgi:drug/metabolite transporter (DMT)-like permease